MRWRSTMYAAVVALIGLVSAGRADEMAARAILEKGLKAMGGADNVAKFKGGKFKIKGTYYGMGLMAPYTGEWAMQLPDRMRYTIESEVNGMKFSFAQAYDRGKGWRQIAGLAWSGRGRITRVEVSADGGSTWHDAELQGPVLPKAHTRFALMWHWDGGEAVLLSRATDETGYVQPTRTALMAARGQGTDYHTNAIRGWRVAADGAVTFHWET